MYFSPDHCGPVGWVSSHKAKGHWFNSWSGHMSGLRVWSLVRAHLRDKRSIFSLTWMFSPFFSLSFPLSKKDVFHVLQFNPMMKIFPPTPVTWAFTYLWSDFRLLCEVNSIVGMRDLTDHLLLKSLTKTSDLGTI